jgi:hypothetical protein
MDTAFLAHVPGELEPLPLKRFLAARAAPERVVRVRSDAAIHVGDDELIVSQRQTILEPPPYGGQTAVENTRGVNGRATLDPAA